MKDNEVIPCDICGKDIEWKYTEEGEPYWTSGHNARPLADGRCCDACNEVVVNYRMLQVIKRRRGE